MNSLNVVADRHATFVVRHAEDPIRVHVAQDGAGESFVSVGLDRFAFGLMIDATVANSRRASWADATNPSASTSRQEFVG